MSHFARAADSTKTCSNDCKDTFRKTNTLDFMEKFENCNCYSLFLVHVTAVISGSSCEGANTWNRIKRGAMLGTARGPLPGGDTVTISPYPR